MKVDTKQVVKESPVLVRVSIEIAFLAVAATAIGMWFLLTFPVAVISEPQTVAAFGNDPTNSVPLVWTAPGDDGVIGRATAYDLRYSTELLTDANWASATPVDGAPVPSPAGTTETFIVDGLVPNTTYSFAVKTVDEAGNWSPISNIATKTTACLEAWSCGEWSVCAAGTQTRTCTDLNFCGTQQQKPTEQQSCSEGQGEEPPVGGEQGTYQESFIVVAPNAGGEPRVKIFHQDGTLFADFLAYDAKFRGGVRLAVGDLGADGIDEIVTAPGPGMAPLVKVFNSRGRLIQQFLAYGTKFRGGVNVAIGNLDGSGGSEIVTTPASKGGSNVRIFGFRGTGYTPVIQNFFAFPSRYHGSWNLTVADLDHNGKAEVLVVPGTASGGPHVKIFEYRGNRMRENILGTMVFNKTFRGGVILASADLTGTGNANIIVAPEARGGPQVRIFGRKYDGSLRLVNTGFYAFSTSYTGGVSLAAGDFTSDGEDEIVAAVRSGDESIIRIFTGDGRRIVATFRAYPSSNHIGLSGLGVGHFFPAQ